MAFDERVISNFGVLAAIVEGGSFGARRNRRAKLHPTRRPGRTPSDWLGESFPLYAALPVESPACRMADEGLDASPAPSPR